MRLLKWKPILLGCLGGFGFALYALVAGFDRYDLSVRQFVMVNLVEPVATTLGHATGDTEGWTGSLILTPLLWFVFWCLIGALSGVVFNLLRGLVAAWRAHETA
jgi:hypothetical protein